MLARRDTTFEQFSIRVDPAGSPTLLKPPTHTGSGASVVQGIVPPRTTPAPPGARTHHERPRSRQTYRWGTLSRPRHGWSTLVPADRGKGRSRWRPHPGAVVAGTRGERDGSGLHAHPGSFTAHREDSTMSTQDI